MYSDSNSGSRSRHVVVTIEEGLTSIIYCLLDGCVSCIPTFTFHDLITHGGYQNRFLNGIIATI